LRSLGFGSHRPEPLITDTSTEAVGCLANYSLPVAATEADRAAGALVERFAPSSSRVLGYVAAGAGALLVLVSLLTDPVANRGLAYFGVAMSLLAWVVLIRPLVSAHERGVLLQNMARDAFVPWSCIQRTRVLQTLQVVTAGKTYHGLGVSRSARSMMREARRGQPAPGGFLGVGGSGAFGRSYPEPAGHRGGSHSGLTYQSYVESRLLDLASSHTDAPPGSVATRADSSGRDPMHSETGSSPVVVWATLPLVALALAAACVGAIFVL
jgi:hypothetical protein